MTLSQRLERLERQNRWMRGISAAGIAALAACLLMGQSKDEPRTLEASSFVLVDASGVKRARLAMWQHRTGSHPALEFFDDGGERTTTLAGGRSPHLILESSKSHVILMLGASGNPAFTCGRGRMGSSDGEVFSLQMMDDDFPHLTLYSKDGSIVWNSPRKK